MLWKIDYNLLKFGIKLPVKDVLGGTVYESEGEENYPIGQPLFIITFFSTLKG